MPDVISQASTQYEGDSALIEEYEENKTVQSYYPSSARPKRSFVLADISDPSNGSSKRPKYTPESIDQYPPFNKKNLGPYHIIAVCPDSSISNLLNELNIPCGIRIELARLVSSGGLNYEDLTERKLRALQGSHEEVVARMDGIFPGISLLTGSKINPAFNKELAVQLPWAELDKETDALAKNIYGGIGNNPEHPDWYGGKVQFRARLQAIEESPSDKDGSSSKIEGSLKKFRIALEKCSLGPSCRFTRRFGSWSFIRVKIPLHLFHDASNQLDTFFQQAFVIWDHVYRACYAKGDNIFLYWTNERASSPQKIPNRLSLCDFIDWHNPIVENSAQLMTKWASRSVLGFSNSVPGPQLEQVCILNMPDIVSEQNSDMTDGCGMSSRQIHGAIFAQLKLPSLPVAFQFRLAGYKGMSMLYDDPEEQAGAKFWVRPSQTKIRYSGGIPLDPAMLTIDLLRTPYMRSPVRLSTDIILNLAENGVPHKEFIHLLQASIRELVNGLTTWEGQDAMLNLWINVERSGAVLRARKARAAGGEARVRGFSERSPEDVELEEEDNDEEGISAESPSVPKSLAWWDDEISGCPSSLEETVMVLLASGFKPQETPVLRDKLKQIVVKKIDNRMENLRFEIDQSCIAFAIPDPFNVLGPDEVHIKSSSRNLKMETEGLLSDIVLGYVLITRNPCKGPCDVRKVTAVEHPLLRDYVDVIVCSIQGYRRLIDWLGGGDYDGDTMIAIWKAAIVMMFQNADPRYSLEPLGLDSAFQRDQEKVADFIQRTQSVTELERCHAMQKYLLGALCDTSLVGKYSTMHDNAIYEYGYFSWRSSKLNAKFCRVLDAPKTGWRIKREALQGDISTYHHLNGPRWKDSGKDKQKRKQIRDDGNIGFLKRGKDLGPFVMDVLRAAAEKERDRLRAEMDKVFKPLDNLIDEDLIKPWDNAMTWAESGDNKSLVKMKKKDLSLIAVHVQNVYQKHNAAMQFDKDKKGFTELPIETRQDTLRAMSKLFHAGPSLDQLPTIISDTELGRIRASYAYKYDAEKKGREVNGVLVHGWSRFPWNVAMRDLCSIKAESLKTHHTIMNEFYERFKAMRWT